MPLCLWSRKNIIRVSEVGTYQSQNSTNADQNINVGNLNYQIYIYSGKSNNNAYLEEVVHASTLMTL
jgi:hypothetical protein